MDKRLLNYYNRELIHLREMSVEFAREYPKIAGRLALGEYECPDPYVERLLEGFAFLAARVHLKLDAQFPRFTNSLLETIYPQYLAPTPSMAIAAFEPDYSEGDLAAGIRIPRNTALWGQVGKNDTTRCEYRTAHDVWLWPVKLVHAAYVTHELQTLNVPLPTGARAAVHLRLQTTGNQPFNQTTCNRLGFYLAGHEELPMHLYEQLLAHTTAIFARPNVVPVPWCEALSRERLQRVGFGPEEALIPVNPRVFDGYRLLQEYFAFPQRFMFLKVDGLDAALARNDRTELDVIFVLNELDLALENNVRAENFRLNCTPVINLFPRRTDRIQLTDRFAEHHVVVDRTRPLDYEIYEIRSVTGYGEMNQYAQEFRSFYAAKDQEETGTAYYVVDRVPRVLSQEEQLFGRRSQYGGSEVYLSLVDAAATPYAQELRQLSVEALCTNRHLPLQMPTNLPTGDFNWDVSAPVLMVRCLAGPTPPRPSFAEGETHWRLISHLALNYLSLCDVREPGAGSGRENREGAAALRDLLKLYGEMAELHVRKQVDGIRSVTSRPLTRRVMGAGPITFARGLEVTISFEESAFEGTGVFLLGAVLDCFLAGYVTINSFTETVVRTLERGEIMRWPARIGQRSII